MHAEVQKFVTGLQSLTLVLHVVLFVPVRRRRRRSGRSCGRSWRTWSWSGALGATASSQLNEDSAAFPFSPSPHLSAPVTPPSPPSSPPDSPPPHQPCLPRALRKPRYRAVVSGWTRSARWFLNCFCFLFFFSYVFFFSCVCLCDLLYSRFITSVFIISTAL